MGASSSSSIEQKSSSSSSMIEQKSFKYDVFLSFRGTDTRKNFIDHLYQALRDKGIYTYKDDERITKGKKINDELLQSIEDSQFYIVVFSKNYASSSWCLDELVKIMECHKTTKHTAYPVFYDVEPKEVRHQTGAVGKAFAKHKNDKAAGKWRNALKDAADLAGFELQNTANGNEARFIQKIIEDISLELHTVDFSFDKKLVGIKSRVNDIVSSLQIGIGDVRMIGIKGMGGAGKTTLARAVFEKISFQFEGKSFIGNVREVTNNPLTGLESLQQQILSDVLNDKDIRVTGDGQNIMKRRMCGRKVLIALDDVDDIQQLEALAGELDWFKSGSRIIITTRDEQVLLSHGVTLICDVNLLSNEEAILLFNKYAFRGEGPVDQGYESLSKQVVQYAAGLPLTIKVLGSLLFGKNKTEWEDALQRLETIPLAKTMKILELSFTVLEDDHKEIFLDVACIMKHWPKDMAIKALESCGFRAKIGLRVLQQKSLITFYKDFFDNECVGMHDHIQEMGWNIVRRSHPNMHHKHNRLRKHEEIEHILAHDLGTEETRCIRFYAGNVDPFILIKCVGKMKTLRDLNKFDGDWSMSLQLNMLSPSFSNALGYLFWKYYPFRSLPKTFQANKLVTLEMPRSKVVDKVLEKLKFLDICISKLRTPHLRLGPDINTWKHLRQYLERLVPEKVPEDLGRLEYLHLSSPQFKHLPDGIFMLKHLKYLKLDGCELLKKLPEDIGHLECLEDLHLPFTKIKHLPDGICVLKHLECLNLHGCELLEKLPEDLGHLECLENLYLSYTKIKHLPDSICRLKHLKSLSLGECLLLEKLPDDLGELKCLEYLNLSSTKIKHLPQNILLIKGLHIYGSRGFLQSFGITSQMRTFRVQDGDNEEMLCYVEL